MRQVYTNITIIVSHLKVFPSTVDVADMHGESPYNIMFGES